MIDFSFTEEQEMFRKSLEKFAQEVLSPGYAERDRLRKFPTEQIKRMASMGLLGLNIPEKYGGRQTDFVTMGIAMEEIGKGDFNCVLPLMMAAYAGHALCNYGNEKQCRQWLPPIVQGDLFLAAGATEPGAGSDLANLKATAVRDGDDYILNGEKNSVSMSNADVYIILARTDLTQSRAKGISAFLLPKNLPGVRISDFQDLGGRSIPRGQVFMEDVRVPTQNLIGEEGTGFKLFMTFLDFNRTFIGLKCLGATQKTLIETMEHMKSRVAFNKPLARFEGISFSIAEAATLIEAARWLSYRALWLIDQGLPHTKEASMCKWWVPQISTKILHRCLLMHGHYGYTDELPIEQRLRDVMGWQIGDGSAEIQKIVIIRELMGREFLPY
jgi:cyclohexanecarboxyl-CoA dehydrogenase